MKRQEFLFAIGTGDGWNCHTVAGGEAWDWSATRATWGTRVGTGQAESRDAAVHAAVVSPRPA